MKKTAPVDDDVNKFIMQLELSAKRILKVANKKDLENRAAMVQSSTHPAPIGGRRKTKDFRDDNHNSLPSMRAFMKTGSVLVTAGNNVSSSTAALLTASSDNLFPLKESATSRSVPGDMETTRLMKYSIPKMVVSMSADVGKIEHMTKTYNNMGSTAGLTSDDAFERDPVFTPYKQPQQAQESSNFQLKNQVAHVLSGKADNIIQVKLPVGNKSSRRRLELQGPVDWASKGLRIKYRSETEREEAWNAWRSASAYAGEAFERKGDVIPITTISRHPLYVSFEGMLDTENTHSNDRTRSRLNMKRFVLDVYEVWLTNLPHLAEHQPSYVLSQNQRKNTTGASTRDQLPPYTVGNSHAMGGDELQSQQMAISQSGRSTFGGASASVVGSNRDSQSSNRALTNGETDVLPNENSLSLDVGLSNRRDTGSLLSLEAQIQSVSQRRALKLAFYTDANMYNFFPIDFDPAMDREQLYDGERLQLLRIANALGVPDTVRAMMISRVPPSQSHSVPVQVLPKLQALRENQAILAPVHAAMHAFGWTVLDDIPPHRILLSIHRLIRNEAVEPPSSSSSGSGGNYGVRGTGNFTIHQLYPLSLWRLTAYNCETMAEECVFFEETAAIEYLTVVKQVPPPEQPDRFHRSSGTTDRPSSQSQSQSLSNSSHQQLSSSGRHRNSNRNINQEQASDVGGSIAGGDPSVGDDASYLKTFEAEYYADMLLKHVEVRMSLSQALAARPATSTPRSSDHNSNTISTLDDNQGNDGDNTAATAASSSSERQQDAQTEELWVKKRAVDMSLTLPGLETTLSHTTTMAFRALLNPRPHEGKNVSSSSSSSRGGEEGREMYVPDSAHEAAANKNGLQGLRVTLEDMLHYASPGLAMQVGGAYSILQNIHAMRPSHQVENVPVPGACAVGRVGLWGLTNAPYPVDVTAFDVQARIDALDAARNCAVLDEKGDELTVNVKAADRHRLRRCGGDFSRISAVFARMHNTIENPPGAFDNPRYMRFKAVLSTAIEAAEIFTTAIYWEDPAYHAFPESKRGPQIGQGPDKWPLEYIKDPNPTQTAAHPFILLATRLVNALESRLSLLASNFNTAPTSLVEVAGNGQNKKDFDAKNNLGEDGRGFKGFRAKIEVSTIDADPELPTVVYGITNAAALPNATGVNTRNIWHATQTITEKINRQRMVGDYLYIIQVKTTSGLNEPDLFTARMRGGEFMSLISLMRFKFEEEYSDVQVKRAKFSRRLALEAKIEASGVLLKARKKNMKQQLRRDLQFEVEKKQRKSYKSELGWKKRYDLSTLIDTQGDWERRRDEKSNLLFWHKKIRQRQLRKDRHRQKELEKGGGLDEDSSTELDGGSINQYDSTDTFALPTKKIKKYEHVPTVADPESTFVAMKEQRDIMNEKAGQSLLKGLGMLVDDTVQWEGKVAVEKFAETCQWEVPAEWVGDPLTVDDIHTDQNRDGTGNHEEGFGLSWQDLSVPLGGNNTAGNSRGGSAPLATGAGSVPAEYTAEMDADAFEEPLESWTPAAEEGTGVGGFVSTRHMRTPGTAPKGDRRWNTPGALAGPGMSPSNGPGGGGVAGMIPPSSALSSYSRGAGSRKGSANVDLKQIAEKLVNNEELLSLLARKLGLPEPKKPIYKGPVPAAPRGGQGGYGSYDEDNEDEYGGNGVGGDGDIADDLWSDGEQLDDGEGEEGMAEAAQMVFDEEAALKGALAKGRKGHGKTKKVKIAGDRPAPRGRRKVETPVTSTVPSQVTFLNIAEAVFGEGDGNGARAAGGDSSFEGGGGSQSDYDQDSQDDEDASDGGNNTSGKHNKEAPIDVKGQGWRRLPRPEVIANFHNRCVESHTMSSATMLGQMSLSPDAATLKELNANAPTYLAPIAPVDAIQYKPMVFSIEVGVVFVKDAKADIERAMGNLERNVQREEEFARGIPTEDLLLKQAEDLENTTVDKALQRQQQEDFESETAIPLPNANNLAAKKKSNSAAVMLAVDRAINAAKSDNVETLEDALEEDLPIDVTDQFGNSLLILAAQQGSKRMCKFLLRRGANLNHQNVSGNTVLHYTVAYDKPDLTKYLITKGANDSILNLSGLTCYEGISTKKITDL